MLSAQKSGSDRSNPLFMNEIILNFSQFCDAIMNTKCSFVIRFFTKANFHSIFLGYL